MEEGAVVLGREHLGLEDKLARLQGVRRLPPRRHVSQDRFHQLKRQNMNLYKNTKGRLPLICTYHAVPFAKGAYVREDVRRC